MHEELEIKLRLPPEALGKLRRLSLPGAVASQRPATRRLRAVYFDTPDFALRRAGFALRVRREGPRWIQSLKGGGGSAAGLHRRLEWESRVPRCEIDVRLLPQDGPGAAARSRKISDALAPLFSTDVFRRARLLAFESGDRIEYCLDRGEIRAGDQVEPVCEIELELKAGAPARLFQVALALVRELPFRVEPDSKAERGYRLAGGSLRAPVRADDIPLPGESSVNDALKGILRSCLAHLQANEDGMLEGADVEYLHQMRVALRRMRSAFTIFNRLVPKEVTEHQVREIRWLTSGLGAARDWDVFVTETLGRIPATGGRASSLEGFVSAARARQERMDALAREAVSSRRYQEFLLGLGAWLAAEAWREALDEEGRARMQQPAVDFARAELERRHRKLVKGGEHLAALAPAERHRMRIAAKKLRYAGEFFTSLFPRKAARSYTKSLAALQDVLGTLNDAAATGHLVREVAGESTESEVISAASFTDGWVASETAHRLGHMGEIWERFLKQKRFWK
jgi:inorganic triphosphatase YgiF